MTMDGGGSPDPAAGGPVHHRPVLRAEVLGVLDAQPDRLFIDGTFGAGGYTRAILATGARVIGLDRDPFVAQAAAAVAADHPGTFAFRQQRFGDLAAVAEMIGGDRVDGIVFDVGVSSMQLDQAERGFSFRYDGPLDMRMESVGPSAADIVNTADEATLAAILFRFGEERDSRRFARAIVHDRIATPFLRTKALADLIERIARGAPKGVHPATKTFQALRIAVNDELGQLLAGLEAAEHMLAPGGILAVVTFHSLEDRIVKRFLSRASGRTAGGSRYLPGPADEAAPSFKVGPGQPVVPGAAEIQENPRARSAKLRWARRTAAPPLGLDAELRALADLGLHHGRR